MTDRRVRLTPVIALVDDDTLARLAPLIAELAERFDGHPQLEANGWTGERIAWGLVIAAASREELVLTDNEA